MSVTGRLYLSRFRLLLLAILLGAGPAVAGLAGPTEAATIVDRHPASHLAGDAFRATVAITYFTYMPLLSRVETCQSTGAIYQAMEIPNWSPTPPAEFHPDLNLALRSYQLKKDAALELIDIGGDTDPGAPQLAGLFAVPHAPNLAAAYQVYNWDWDCNCRGAPIDDVEVTLAELVATPGETVHVPDSGYKIGRGKQALVLYASANRLTLKYTLEDNVIYGYTLHLEDICVDQNLLALYQALNSAGRHQLPALGARQAVGRVYSSGRVKMVIRDTGAFMDPRSRKDWWRGY
jgi:hypothetical protein